MPQQSKFDRILIFGKRKLKAFLYSLSPSRISGRFNGPKVIINSIPKAGTNLADNLFLRLPKLRFSGKRTIRKLTHNIEETIHEIGKMSKGVYHLAHIEYDNTIDTALSISDVKMILIIRDPRQIIVSHYKYVTEIDTNHKTHDFFKGLESDKERINIILKGQENIVKPFHELIQNYAEWQKSKNVLTIKYEDLVGPNGGGTTEAQKEAILKIGEFIKISLSKNQINDLTSQIYNPKSPTFRKGQLDGWRSHLNEEHCATIKNSIVGLWMIENGYEQNNDW